MLLAWPVLLGALRLPIHTSYNRACAPSLAGTLPLPLLLGALLTRAAAVRPAAAFLLAALLGVAAAAVRAMPQSPAVVTGACSVMSTFRVWMSMQVLAYVFWSEGNARLEGRVGDGDWEAASAMRGLGFALAAAAALLGVLALVAWRAAAEVRAMP
mgnify:CR=1 FL=1